MTSGNVNYFDFQIRIIGGSQQTEGDIYFTELNKTVHFDIAPYEVHTFMLDNDEKYAVYNETTGTTSKSIHITTYHSVSVYAFCRFYQYSENSFVLPITALGTEYYQISYITGIDAYVVVATQDNTQIFHNNTLETTLQEGGVYYRTSNPEMTGSHITSNNPIAFFAQHQLTAVGGNDGNNLFEQLASVNTWDTSFFVPFAECENEIIRMVVSQNGTDIEIIGAAIRPGVPGAQETLTGLQAGDFVELEMIEGSNGCFIESNKPIGICTYMRSTNPVSCSSPTTSTAQSWVPGIRQLVPKVLMAPFIPGVSLVPSPLALHYAVICTPTDTKDSTKVSIGGATAIDLSGSTWYDNSAADMSFCRYELIKDSVSYIFSNPEGIIVFGYGTKGLTIFGFPSSYYYLAGSAMRDLEAAFYANDIPCGDLENNPICEKVVFFQAEIENMGVEVDSIKWYIDGEEFEPAQNQEIWNYTFTQQGEYKITMVVYYFENGETKTKTITGTLKRKDLWVKMRNIKH